MPGSRQALPDRAEIPRAAAVKRQPESARGISGTCFNAA